MGDLRRLVRQALEWDLSSQRKSLLRYLFKCSTVNSKSTEDPRNFPDDPGRITLLRNTGENLKVWDHLADAKDAFHNIRMAQIESPFLKKMSQICAGRVPSLLI